MRSADGVRLERTGWRDQEVSARHRMWGFNCPAVDLDFLVAEYHVGKPVALVEYKHFMGKQPDIEHATYRALIDLADQYAPGALPFLIAFYYPEIWAFRVQPVNAAARQHFRCQPYTERQYVSTLYRMRRLVLTRELEARLNDILPPTSVFEMPL